MGALKCVVTLFLSITTYDLNLLSKKRLTGYLTALKGMPRISPAASTSQAIPGARNSFVSLKLKQLSSDTRAMIDCLVTLPVAVFPFPVTLPVTVFPFPVTLPVAV